MGFPSAKLPAYQPIGAGRVVFVPPNSFTVSNIMAVAGYKSLLVVPNHTLSSGPFTFESLTITWYTVAIGEAFNAICDETHYYAPNGNWQPSDTAILTAVKGPYCGVSGGGNLQIYSSDVGLATWARYDSPASLPYAGQESTSITPGALTATDTLVGFARSSPLTIVTKVSNSGTAAFGTFTAKYVINTPGGAVQATVTPAAISVPAAGATAYTAITALPALPVGDAGCPFEIDLTYTLSSSSTSMSLTATTSVY